MICAFSVADSQKVFCSALDRVYCRYVIPYVVSMRYTVNRKLFGIGTDTLRHVMRKYLAFLR